MMMPFSRQIGVTVPADLEVWEQQYYKLIAPLMDEEAARWQTVPKGWRQYTHDGWGYEGYNRALYQTYRPRAQNPYLDAPAGADLATEAQRAASEGFMVDCTCGSLTK